MKPKRLFECMLLAATFLFVSILFVSINFGGLIQSPLQREALAGDGEKTRLYLVGTGPGDADLITLRGLRAIQNADLVVCSIMDQEKFAAYLKGKEIFDTSRFHKYPRKDYLSLTEEELKTRREEWRRQRQETAKVVRRAIKHGKTVAMLQGADPFIYGGGGRACERYADLHPVVIPGLSSFNAANGALAKNVTRGEPTRSVILTSGGSLKGYKIIEEMAVHRATMVVYMPRDLKLLVAKLSAHYPPEAPVAIVSYAGYKEKERVIKGTLNTILNKVSDEKNLKLYLVYVGDFLTFRYFKEKQ